MLSSVESHATENLFLYTVNTREIYFGRVKDLLEYRAERIAKDLPVTDQVWKIVVREGIKEYRREFKESVFSEVDLDRVNVLIDSCAGLIADHYAEELVELVEKAKESES